MLDVSDDMIDDAFAEDAGETVILVTLTADGLAEPFRACSHEGGIVSSAGEESAFEYEYFPFALTFGGAGPGEMARDATLEIDNSDGAILEAIRTATGTPSVVVQAVRLEAPNAAEMTLEGTPIVSAQATDPKVSAALQAVRVGDEPAVSARYTLKRCPSLA